jgi:hypothetical protein
MKWGVPRAVSCEIDDDRVTEGVGAAEAMIDVAPSLAEVARNVRLFVGPGIEDGGSVCRKRQTRPLREASRFPGRSAVDALPDSGAYRSRKIRCLDRLQPGSR